MQGSKTLQRQSNLQRIREYWQTETTTQKNLREKSRKFAWCTENWKLKAFITRYRKNKIWLIALRTEYLKSTEFLTIYFKFFITIGNLNVNISPYMGPHVILPWNEGVQKKKIRHNLYFSMILSGSLTPPLFGYNRREIRLIEGNAKCRHLKNWPV